MRIYFLAHTSNNLSDYYSGFKCIKLFYIKVVLKESESEHAEIECLLGSNLAPIKIKCGGKSIHKQR